MARSIFYDSLKKILFAFVAMMFVAPAFSATLPAGYTELEYIESTGTQYIDTEIQPDDNTETQVIGQYTELAAHATLFGVFYANAIKYYGLGLASGTRWRLWYGSSGSPWVIFGTSDTDKHTFALKNKSIYIDNMTTPVATSELSVTEPSRKMYLFAADNGGNMGYASKAKIYSAKIWNNGTLVRDFVPAQTTINGEKVNGMYDTVGNQFYRSAASGTNFTAGPAKCRNLLNPDNFLEIINDVYPNFAGSRPRAGWVVQLPAGTYTASANGYVMYLRTSADGNTWSDYGTATDGYTFTLDATKYVALYSAKNADPDIVRSKNIQLEQGSTATIYVPYCASTGGIKIATTKYNEDAFANLVTTLNSAITKVTNIVDTTVAQASSIGTLATTKQDRPADGDCPAGRKCLLVTGTDGKPHWYLIQE